MRCNKGRIVRCNKGRIVRCNKGRIVRCNKGRVEQIHTAYIISALYQRDKSQLRAEVKKYFGLNGG